MTVIHLERLSSGPTKSTVHTASVAYCQDTVTLFIIVRNVTYITAIETVGPRFR